MPILWEEKMTTKELIAIDKKLLDQIIDNHDVLHHLKKQIMAQPLEKPLTRLDFNVLVNCIDKLSHSIYRMEQER